MTDLPILFSAPMIQALLDGSKTMTRRLAWKVDPVWSDGGVIYDAAGGQEDYIEPHIVADGKPSRWQKVKPGDRLWVREALNLRGDRPDLPIWQASYRADSSPLDLSIPGNLALAERRAELPNGRFVNSIYMPRCASRLTLIVKHVKIEWLQNISEADAIAEGCDLYVPGHGFINKADLHEGYSNYLAPKMGFEKIWRSLHGPEIWDANPQVVAISFRVIRANIDSEKARVT